MKQNEMVILTNNDISSLAQMLADSLRKADVKVIYAVPRGGVPAAYAVMAAEPSLVLTDNPEEADAFIDDIIDSGSTMQRYCDLYPSKMFFGLIDKTNADDPFHNCWVVFPWEGTATSSIEDNIIRLLQYVGEDPKRGGLLETPKRVAKAWLDWCSGYSQDPAAILKTFEDGAENCDEMVVRAVPFYSHCEHHMAAIIGTAVVAYIPNEKIVGLSKIDRVVDVFARRLQVQERLTNQIAQAIMDNLQPKGVAVWVNARHLCIESRGVRNPHSDTDTCALRGVFKDDARTRDEFLSIARTKV